MSRNLLSEEDKDGRFANEWVTYYGIFNCLLLVDLIAAFVFYGWKTLLMARQEFLWEACVQFAFFSTLIYYLVMDMN